MLSALHQMDQPRERSLQVGRFQGRLKTLGSTQEQTRHELRNYGPSTEVFLVVYFYFISTFFKFAYCILQVLLSTWHFGQSGRSATRLPVCRRT